jgi:hypothetical protein
MNCSIGTSKANYHHAVQKLKVLMGDRNTSRDPKPGKQER